MRAAGVRQIGGAVELLELAEPRALRADEILLDVRACGVGNWDEFVRTGGWDTGIRPPMALGVEAAGVVAAVGTSAGGFKPGDRVTTHSVPLREQGSWAEWFIVPAEHCSVLPSGVPFDAGAALPVPALTGQVRQLTNGGVDAAANAARSGAGDAVQAVRDGGRLATITADPPAAERGITVREVQVVPGGARLGELARLAAQGVLTISSTRSYPLEQAGTALAQARHGAHGAAVVLSVR